MLLFLQGWLILGLTFLALLLFAYGWAWLVDRCGQWWEARRSRVPPSAGSSRSSASQACS